MAEFNLLEEPWIPCIDLQGARVEYGIRDTMLKATDTKDAPWYIVPSDDKRRARLNCIAHLLRLIPYKEVDRDKVKLPKRLDKGEYDDQVTLKGRTFVPEEY